MNPEARRPFSLVAASWTAAATLLGDSLAQERTEVKFAAPVRLHAGGKFLGGNRLFPSPVLRDMNGDGIADVVVGDLFGKVTVALRTPGKDPLAFAAETELKTADGKPIDFHNW